MCKSKLKNIDDYEKQGNDYGNWVRKADDLIFSSRVLEKQYFNASNKMKKEKSGVVPNGFRCDSSMFLLRAAATELYLKALYLRQGGKLCENNRYKGYKGHDLGKLAEEIIKIKINKSEKDILEKLSSSLTFWGKYPIPLSSSDWRKKVKGIEGIQPIFCWGKTDLEVLDKFLERIKFKINQDLKKDVVKLS